MSTTEINRENVIKFIGTLKLSQTCDLLYRCNDNDPVNEWVVPALIARLRELVDPDRADYIINHIARDHYGVSIETIITKAKTTGKITVFRVDGREVARIQQGRPGLHQPAFHSIIGTEWAEHKCYREAEKHIENVLSGLYATCGVRFIEA